MKVNAKDLKEQLTLEDIIQIVEALNGELITTSNEFYIFSSVCHHIDAENHSKKLYYYKDSNSFKCYSCGFHGDIYSLIEERWCLEELEYSFFDIINFCIDNSSVDIQNINSSQPKKQNCWNWLEKYNKTNESYDLELTIYNKKIMDFFDNTYHQSWLDDNITIKTMDKFNIKFYPYKQCIVIPVYNINGDLIGIHCRNTNPQLIKMGYKYMPLSTLDNEEYKFPTSGVLYGLYENQDNIKKAKSVILVEAPKSVMQLEDILDSNISVGLFGTNLSNYKRNLLIQLGVENFYIAIDKQYKKWYTNEEVEDTEEYKEFQKYIKTVDKIAKSLCGYGNVYVIYDDGCQLNYKDSPTDKGTEVWNNLFNKTEKLYDINII